MRVHWIRVAGKLADWLNAIVAGNPGAWPFVRIVRTINFFLLSKQTVVFKFGDLVPIATITELLPNCSGR